MTTSYLINQTPSFLLQQKSPYEVLFERVPTYDQLRVFGCLCYVHQNGKERDKFCERSRKCVFLGYPYGKKGWHVYNVEKEEYLVSRDVVFHENAFPFAIGQDSTNNKEP